MAKILFGPMAGGASGSIEGTVFSHNRNGNYIRSKGIPTNPNTPAQAQVRSYFGALSQTWRTLNSGQRSTWDLLGPQMQRVDSLGQSYTLTGAQAFIAINQLRRTAGLSIVQTAPALDAAPASNVVTFIATGSATPGSRVMTFTLSAPNLGTGSIRVFATAPMSAGRKYIKTSQYRFLGTFTGLQTNPISILTLWQAIFGNLTEASAGTRISLRIYPVSANGIASTFSRADAIVTSV